MTILLILLYSVLLVCNVGMGNAAFNSPGIPVWVAKIHFIVVGWLALSIVALVTS